MQELEDESCRPNFWNNQEHAQNVMKEKTILGQVVSNWKLHFQQLEDLRVLLELAKEEQDGGVSEEVQEKSQQLERGIQRMELSRMLNGPMDGNNAILTMKNSNLDKGMYSPKGTSFILSYRDRTLP